MEKPFRKLFFWTLVFLFLVVAPVIVLYARGYRFDSDRGVFVHSGTVTIKTNPADIDIFINGEEQSTSVNRINSSLNITGLVPRTYDLAVSAPGFQKWTKRVDVHSGVSTEFWNVLLARENYDHTAYNSSGVEKFFISPENDFIAWIKNFPDEFSLKILDIRGNSNINEFSFVKAHFPVEKLDENIEWSPKKDFLSVPAEITVPASKSGEDPVVATAYFIIDIAEKKSFNFNDFIGLNNIRDLRWDPQNKNFLFFLSENSLFRADIRDKNALTLIAPEVSAFELSRSHVYYSQKPNELVYRSEFDGQGRKIQITETFPQDAPLATEKLIIYDEARIAFLDELGRLFVKNKGGRQEYFRKIGDSVRGMQFSNDGKKLLFWTGNELSVYFLRDWNVQPARSENEIQNITRYSEPIRNAQWFKDYEHVIFTTGNKIKIIELDPRDRRNCQDITSLSTDQPFIVYNHSLENIFFIDRDGDSSKIFSLIFPEKIGLFGFAR